MTVDNVLLILSGLPWTIVLTFGAFAIGCLLGVPLVAARKSTFAPFRWTAAIFIQIVRALPPILWLFIIFFGVGMSLMPINPLLAALIGLGVIAGANMAEIYRGALASLHHGQWEATTALNFSRRHTLIDVVIPQAFRVALPSSASYLIGLMKETAVASTIGVTDLAFRGNQLSQLTFKGIEVFALVGLFYIFMSLPIAWLSRSADRYLRAKVAR